MFVVIMAAAGGHAHVRETSLEQTDNWLEQPDSWLEGTSWLPGRLVNLGGGGCSPGSRCGVCHGDCDKDADCAPGLMCFFRDGLHAVPGCRPGGPGDKPSYDFCVPQRPTTRPTSRPTKRPTTRPTSRPTKRPTKAPEGIGGLKAVPVTVLTDEAVPTRLPARLYLPASPGPRPAIVFMHGGGGLYRNNDPSDVIDAYFRRWAGMAHERGFAALFIDSYTPRGGKAQASEVTAEAEAEGEP
jgi:hypothetical protein